jgi:hypothetical protein
LAILAIERLEVTSFGNSIFCFLALKLTIKPVTKFLLVLIFSFPLTGRLSALSLHFSIIGFELKHSFS